MRATNQIVKKSNSNNGSTPKKDYFLWLLVVLILVVGIAANYYYSQAPGALRAAAGIVVGAIALGIASLTALGQQAWEFAKGARIELRKVVWPTRQETVQTTMIVVAMVLLMALILWGLDSLLLWGVSFLTGK
jgi:preprotein translocase subunit SecE